MAVLGGNYTYMNQRGFKGNSPAARDQPLTRSRQRAMVAGNDVDQLLFYVGGIGPIHSPAWRTARRSTRRRTSRRTVTGIRKTGKCTAPSSAFNFGRRPSSCILRLLGRPATMDCRSEQSHLGSLFSSSCVENPVGTRPLPAAAGRRSPKFDVEANDADAPSAPSCCPAWRCWGLPVVAGSAPPPTTGGDPDRAPDRAAILADHRRRFGAQIVVGGLV